VTVTTALGQKHTFDFLVGADGLKSVVRQALFPEVNPKARTPNCAYRAIVPYSLILKDLIAAPLIKIPTMEVWMGDNSYIITYPISGSTEMNLVLSHHVDYPVTSPEPIAISVLQEQFKNYDPRIKRVVDMITESNRWPLLVTGPLESWSSKEKNVVLIGDAAHSMVNHMAQGAATSMEDGAFLGRCLAQVVAGKITLEQAVKVYETERMPKAKFKQKISFLNGCIWHLPDGPVQRKRDEAMKGELVGRREDGSPNLYGDPKMMKLVYGYDAEEHADMALERFLRGEPRIDDSDELDKETEELFRKWSVGEMEVSAKL
jgi:salicylate hydroxylase